MSLLWAAFLGSSAAGAYLTVTAGARDRVVSPGSRTVLTLVVQLEAGMHVYAPGVKGYIPIEWKITESKGWLAQPVKYPQPRKLHFPEINETVLVFDGRFRLERDLVVGKVPAGELAVGGTLRYQACDDKQCFPPKTEPLKWEFRVIEGAAGTDHSTWDSLLKRYVNTDSRVDYRSWKETGLKDLDSYLGQLAQPWPQTMTGNAKKAAFINAYNALTIRWVLENYPVASIWRTRHPFDMARHTVNQEKRSLDAIESRLREMGDPRIHAALVCAARSCPPLRREAYVADRIDQQLEENTRAWLANTSLNEFFPEGRLAKVSMIFKWYRQDFDQGGGSLESFLARFAPPEKSGFLGQRGAKIEYKTYLWGLNDASGLGSDYSQTRFLWDRFRSLL